jgi:hypothetical protein
MAHHADIWSGAWLFRQASARLRAAAGLPWGDYDRGSFE